MRATAFKLILSLLWIVSFTGEGFTFEIQSSIGVGYRQDQLQWSLARNLAGTDPNILSELKWDVESFVVSPDLWLIIGNSNVSGTNKLAKSPRFFLHLQGDYGWIYNGENRDSDFSGDNRTGEYSRTENAADDGTVYDLIGVIGGEWIHIIHDQKTLTLTPTIGYSYNVQKLSITDGVQTLTSPGSPPLGPIVGLDSHYDTEWYGPLAGIALRYTRFDAQGPSFNIWLEGQYHWVEYRAEGIWNLRTDLAQSPSFKDRAKGSGWDISWGWKYHFSAHSSLTAELEYSRWQADRNGIATIYSSDGTTVASRFNEVEWTKKQIKLGYLYKF